MSVNFHVRYFYWFLNKLSLKLRILSKQKIFVGPIKPSIILLAI